MTDTDPGYPENDPEFLQVKRDYEESGRAPTPCVEHEWNEQQSCNVCGIERRQVR